MAIPLPLDYLFFAWGAVTAVLIALVIYGNALSTREDEEIYINKNEENIMASGQRALVGRMDRLAKAIFYLAVASGVLLLATAAVWTYIGLSM